MGEAVAVAVATCPDALEASMSGLTPRAPKENAGRDGASPEGLGAVKEKLAAEGKIEEVEGVAPKEKREEAVEGRLKERPEEEEAGGAGAAVEAGGAEVAAGVNDGKTGGSGLDAAGT